MSNDLALVLVLAIWIPIAGFTIALCLHRPDKLDFFKKPEKEEDHDLFV
jgi:hypothetical protein